MTLVRLRAITKRFGAAKALDDVSLDIPNGALVAVLGASGCGKTTLLRLVAGFEAPDEGEILFDDEIVAGPRHLVPPERRQVGVVFQSYALWPHLNVAENVAYPLRAHGVRKRDVPGRVEAVLREVGLEGYGERSVEQLSGGQRQRVALARCLVADSRVILFDEPLANLDMHLRASMGRFFRRVHERTGATMIYVTHDQGEALALADRVVVMNAGRIQQIGTPETVYREPANSLVAGFVGQGSLLRAETVGQPDGGTADVAVGGVRFRARAGGTGGDTVLVRPEAVRPGAEGVPARVAAVTYRGGVFEIEATLADGQSLVFSHRAALTPGAHVHLAIEDSWLVPGA